MNISILLALSLATNAAPANSYTYTTTVVKNYNGASYDETTVKCKSGSFVYTKTVTFADAGFGITAYYVNEVPYETDRGEAVLKTQGRYNTFDAAAQKACFG